MALNSSDLASQMEAGIRFAMELGDEPYPKMTSYCETLAQTIVNHIKNNTVVTVEVEIPGIIPPGGLTISASGSVE